MYHQDDAKLTKFHQHQNSVESAGAKLQGELDGQEGTKNTGGAWVMPLAIVGTGIFVAAVVGTIFVIQKRQSQDLEEEYDETPFASGEDGWNENQQERQHAQNLSPNQEHENVASI